MAKYESTIVYHLKTQLEKSGITQLTNSLKSVEAQMDRMSKKTGAISYANAAQSAKQLSSVLQNSFNKDIGALSVAQFNKNLKTTQLTLKEHYNNLSKAGPAGKSAFYNMFTQVTNLNTGIKQSNVLLDKMATTMGNTVRWGITAVIFQNIASEIRNAVRFVKDLDESLNNIRIVTGKSANQMKDFATQANKAAQSLGTTTKEYTDASLIYFQQGLSAKEVQARTEITIKAANITGQKAQEVSDQLTAVWNGYKAQGIELQAFADKLAAVAAGSAADMEELATATSKTASVAKMTGMSFDQLTAMIATAVSVTKQAPESVGVAFKTVLARMTDLRAAGKISAENAEDFAVSLGQVSTQLGKMGINILDQAGNLRKSGDLMTEIGTKWQTLNDAQRTALAQALAGKRQWNILASVFENWGLYTDQLIISQNSLGTVTAQNNTRLESAAAQIEILKAKSEALYAAIFDTSSIVTATKTLGVFVDTLTNFITGLGGGLQLFKGLAGVAFTLFNKQIGTAIQGLITNFKIFKSTATEFQAIKQLMIDVGHTFDNLSNKGLGQLLTQTEAMVPLLKYMTEEERQVFQEIQKQTVALLEQRDVLKENSKLTMSKYQNIMGYSNKKNMPITIAQGSLEGSLKYVGDERTIPGNIKIQESKQQLEGDLAALSEASIKIRAVRNTIKEDIKKFSKTDSDTNIGLIIELEDKIQTLTKDSAIYGRNADKLKQALDLIGKSKQETNSNIAQAQLQEALQITSNLMGTMAGQSERLATEIDDAMATGKQRAKELSDEMKRLKDNIDQIRKGLTTRQFWSGFTQAAGGITELSFALEGLLNIWDVWENKDSTFTEKILRTFTSLGFIIPSLVSGIKSMGEGIGYIYERASKKGLSQMEAELEVITAKKAAVERDLSTSKLAKAEPLGATTAASIREKSSKKVISDEIAGSKVQATIGKNASRASAAKEIAGEEVEATIEQNSARAAAAVKLAASTGSSVAGMANKGGQVVAGEIAGGFAKAPFAAAGANAAKAVVPAATATTARTLGSSIMGLFGGPVGIAITAGLVIWGIASYFKKKKEEARQAIIDDFNKIQDQFNQEASLQKQYSDAYSIFKSTGEGKQQLLDLSKELTQVYGDESYELLALTGNYELINKKLKENIKLLAAERATKAEKAAKAVLEENPIPKIDTPGNINNQISPYLHQRPALKIQATTIDEVRQRLKELTLQQSKANRENSMSAAEMASLNRQIEEYSNWLSTIAPQIEAAAKAQAEAFSLSFDPKTMSIKEFEAQIMAAANRMYGAAGGEMSFEQILTMLYTTLGQNSNLPPEIAAKYQDAALILSESGLNYKETNELISELGWDNIHIALQKLQEDGKEINEGSIREAIQFFLDNPELKMDFLVEIEYKEKIAGIKEVQDALQKAFSGEELSDSEITFLQSTYQKELGSITPDTEEWTRALVELEEQLLNSAKAQKDFTTVAETEDTRRNRQIDSLENLKTSADRLSTAEKEYAEAKKRYKKGSLELLLAEAKLEDARKDNKKAIADYIYNTIMASDANNLLGTAVREAADAIANMSTEQARAELKKLEAAAISTSEVYASLLDGIASVYDNIEGGMRGDDLRALSDEQKAELTEARQKAEEARAAAAAFRAAMKAKPSGISDQNTNASGQADQSEVDLEEKITGSVDVYYEVNKQLEILAELLNRINKEQEKLTGDALIRSLEKQKNLIKEQVKWQLEKIRLMRLEQSDRMFILSGKGIQFDKSGQITFESYKSTLQAAENKANAAIEESNAAKIAAAEARAEAAEAKAESEVEDTSKTSMSKTSLSETDTEPEIKITVQSTGVTTETTTEEPRFSAQKVAIGGGGGATPPDPAQNPYFDSIDRGGSRNSPGGNTWTNYENINKAEQSRIASTARRHQQSISFINAVQAANPYWSDSKSRQLQERAVWKGARGKAPFFDRDYYPLANTPEGYKKYQELFVKAYNEREGNFLKNFDLDAATGRLTPAGYGWTKGKTGQDWQKGKGKYGLQTFFADNLEALNIAMEAAGLGRFTVTDGFRDYAGQIRAKNKHGKKAATPGNSVHGLGMAADLNLTNAQYNWMAKNSKQFGIVNLPGETWHWQVDPASMKKQIQRSKELNRASLRATLGKTAYENLSKPKDKQKSTGTFTIDIPKNASDKNSWRGQAAWRNNNPGNIMYPGDGSWVEKFGGKRGDEKASGGYWTKFDTPEAGFRAQAELVFRRQYKDDTIVGMLRKYAPKKDGNDPEKYAADVVKTMKMRGITVDTLLKDISKIKNGEISLLAAMSQHEGGTKITWAGTPDLKISGTSSTGSTSGKAGTGRVPEVPGRTQNELEQEYYAINPEGNYYEFVEKSKARTAEEAKAELEQLKKEIEEYNEKLLEIEKTVNEVLEGKTKIRELNLQIFEAKLAKLDSKIERYGKSLEHLQKLQEFLTGVELVNNLTKQQGLISKQLDSNSKKYETAMKRMNSLNKKFATETKGYLYKGYNLVFDEEGNIVDSSLEKEQKRREENIKKVQEKLQKAVKDKDQNKITYWQEILIKEQDALNTMMEYAEEYTTLINDILPELKEAAYDYMVQAIELEISKITIAVQVELDLKQAERQWSEFLSGLETMFLNDPIGNILHRFEFISGELPKLFKPLEKAAGQVYEAAKAANETAKALVASRDRAPESTINPDEDFSSWTFDKATGQFWDPTGKYSISSGAYYDWKNDLTPEESNIVSKITNAPNVPVTPYDKSKGVPKNINDWKLDKATGNMVSPSGKTFVDKKTYDAWKKIDKNKKSEDKKLLKSIKTKSGEAYDISKGIPKDIDKWKKDKTTGKMVSPDGKYNVDEKTWKAWTKYEESRKAAESKLLGNMKNAPYTRAETPYDISKGLPKDLDKWKEDPKTGMMVSPDGMLRVDKETWQIWKNARDKRAEQRSDIVSKITYASGTFAESPYDTSKGVPKNISKWTEDKETGRMVSPDGKMSVDKKTWQAWQKSQKDKDNADEKLRKKIKTKRGEAYEGNEIPEDVAKWKEDKATGEMVSPDGKYNVDKKTWQTWMNYEKKRKENRTNLLSNITYASGTFGERSYTSIGEAYDISKGLPKGIKDWVEDKETGRMVSSTGKTYVDKKIYDAWKTEEDKKEAEKKKLLKGIKTKKGDPYPGTGIPKDIEKWKWDKETKRMVSPDGKYNVAKSVWQAWMNYEKKRKEAEGKMLGNIKTVPTNVPDNIADWKEDKETGRMVSPDGSMYVDKATWTSWMSGEGIGDRDLTREIKNKDGSYAFRSPDFNGVNFDDLTFDEIVEMFSDNAVISGAIAKAREENPYLTKDELVDVIAEAAQEGEVDAAEGYYDSEIAIVTKAYEEAKNWNETAKSLEEKDNLTSGDILDMFKDNADVYKAIEEYIKTQEAEGNEVTLDDIINTVIKATEEAVESTRSMLKNLIDQYTAYLQDLLSGMLDLIEEFNKEYQKIYEKAELINKSLQHQASLIKLIYGDEAFDMMDAYYEAQKTSNATLMATYQQHLSQLQALRQKAIEEGWDQSIIDQIDQDIADTQNNINNLIISSIELLQAQYANTVRQVLTEVMKALTGGLSLSELEQEWQRINEQADFYLDKMTRNYSLGKIENAFLEAIDEAGDPKAQEALNALMKQELAYLESKGELTQYDVDRSLLLLETEKKRIALEEGYLNKTKLKLTKSKTGGYSFAFYADAGEQRKLEQEYNDSKQKLYEMDMAALKQNQEAGLNALKNYQARATEIAEDTTLSPEEMAAKLKEAENDYLETMARIGKENDHIRENLGDNLDENDERWNNSVQGMITSYNKKPEGFTYQITSAHGKIIQASENYRAELKKLETSAGTTFGNIVGNLNSAIAATSGLVVITSGLADTYARVASGLSSLNGVYQEYIDLLDQVIEKLKEIDELENPPEDGDAGDDTGNGGNTSWPGPTEEEAPWQSIEDPMPTENDIPEIGESIKVKAGAQGYDIPEDGDKLNIVPEELLGTIDRVHTDLKVPNPYFITFGEGYPTGWYSKDALVPGSFDTGGYTGEWGDSGKLAFLHQKELVLNRDDTSKLLETIKDVRAIESSASTIAHQIAKERIANLELNGYGNIKTKQPSTETVLQEINLSADFPNANNAIEIERALNNLVNSATQYAYKSRRFNS